MESAAAPSNGQISKFKAFFTKQRMAYFFIGVVGLMVLLSILAFFGDVDSPDLHLPSPEPAMHAQAAPEAHGEAAAEGHGETEPHTAAVSAPPGTVFTLAAMEPMRYELHERFWGWRPNDITRGITDNLNEYQLGVLEVTRRTATNLAKHLSRTGSTDAFDPNLEAAMNQFMIGAKSFMWPSAEGAYSDGLKQMEKYAQLLGRHQAHFYVRSDNLIPLLRDFRDLLGSCDDNLVKLHEEDGRRVSTFSADNYYYYAKGVASALHVILEGVAEDFGDTLRPRQAMEPLEHAIHECARAKEMDPLIIIEGSTSGFLANHRSNLAAPISHARFYLDVLIETLST